MQTLLQSFQEVAVHSSKAACSVRPLVGRLGCCRRSPAINKHAASQRLEAGSVQFGKPPQAHRNGRAAHKYRASGDASVSTAADVTHSNLIQKEVVLFLIQLDFDRQLQRALNYDKFEAANEIRARREELTEAVEEFQASKGAGDGARAATRREAADFTSEGLRLRSEMQRAAEEERYKDASALRDRLNELQQKAEAAAAASAAAGGSTERQLRLGQRVLHSQHGFRGAICGWDSCCCEDEEWQSVNGISDLQRGAQQPFYHLLVDVRDWSDPNPDSAIAYVPEEALLLPEANDTWSDQHGADSFFMHPYAGILFLGCDHVGDFVPSRALREKYSTPRRDVGPEDDGEDEDDGGGSGASDPDQGPDGDGPGGLDIGGPGGGLTIM